MEGIVLELMKYKLIIWKDKIDKFLIRLVKRKTEENKIRNERRILIYIVYNVDINGFYKIISF